ncbi:MAG: tandem-95 repeat protein [Verrucomicrobia bacterium]|jgi:predicted hotdog family 3-hydroxylacyl-ACP dehydratase|nr:tandem-95 repeat protein [Verrucomicrobiota bacterium]
MKSKTSFLGILSLKNRFLPILGVLALSTHAHAADVTLAWDPSPDAGVGSYRLHYGTASGNYTSVTNAGLSTTVTVTGLVEGTTYYFGATAVGTNQLESDFSNEISYTVPLPQNTAPTITVINNQTINEDAVAGPISITVGDQETPATALTLSGSSSNPTLVPNASVVFGGSGASRNVTVTPAADASGTAQITVTVSDGELTFSRQFTVTVTAVNDSPALTSISNQTIEEDAAAGPISFTVSDVETSASSLTLGGTSSNPTLVPNANIVFGGSGANRAVTVTPVANGSGSAVITVTVSDGALTANQQFTLTVAAVNDRPTVASISNQTINEDAIAGPISFTIGDSETAAGSLTVSATSGDAVLVPQSGLVLAGSGTNRTLTVTPATNQFGPAQITVSVSDGVLTATSQFTLTVTSVNDTPTLTSITNRAINEDTSTGPISFTVGDVETAADMLTLSGTSSNPTLVPNANITFGGSGAARSVTVTPAANQFGTAQVTVTVSDGSQSANRVFTLTVNSVEDPPRAPINLRIAQVQLP